jgi:hypothetical protein
MSMLRTAKNVTLTRIAVSAPVLSLAAAVVDGWKWV